MTRTDALIVPGEVWATDEHLEWRDSQKHLPRRAPIPAALLDRFLALATADGDQIARFASRFGILGICEHGLPCTHNVRRRWRIQEGVPLDDQDCVPGEMGEDGWQGREPLKAWRQLAGRARDIVRVSDAANGLVFDAESWNRITGQQLQRRRRPTSLQLREAVAVRLQEWLELAGVRPQFTWTDEKPTITFGTRATWEPIPARPKRLDGHLHGTTLFGALVLQLIVRVAGDDMARCSNCHVDYLPTKQPAAGRRNYCYDCREKGVPLRDAQRARRARLCQ